jgi:uncharacterized protein (TIGR02265 family)
MESHPMSYDATALDELLGRLPPKETVRGFVFNAVTAHLAAKVGPEIASGMQERITRKRPVDLFNYPAADFFRLIYGGVGALLSQTESAEVAMQDLGYASAAGFFVSPTGRLLLAMVGTEDPAKLMANEPTAYATSFSFGRRAYAKNGTRELTLTHADDFLPIDFNVGALKSALDAAKAPAKVVAHPEGRDGARYVLSW